MRCYLYSNKPPLSPFCCSCEPKIIHRSDFGFSLVELMIAMLLSSGLIAAVLQVFAVSRQSATVQIALIDVQESGRLISQILKRDIRMSGFWGCGGNNSIRNHLDVNEKKYKDFQSLQAVSGVDNWLAGQFIGSVSIKEGTDSITLKGAVTLNAYKLPEIYKTDRVIIAGRGDYRLRKKSVLLLSDCYGGELFLATVKNRAGTTHLTAELKGIVNLASQDQYFSRDFPDADLLKPFSKQYFIGSSDAGAGDGSDNSKEINWSLYVRESGYRPQELVRYVDDLQVAYGVDMNNDGVLDTYQKSSLSVNMNNVLSIQVDIGVQSRQKVIQVSGMSSPMSRRYRLLASLRNRILQ